MGVTFGERISGLTVDGKELQAAVFNENQVRAAAGITMVVGAVAFAFAYFEKQYIPLQVVSTFFFVEFLIRSTMGIKYSPVGVVAHLMTRYREPDWVSAKPKRFAWQLALALAFSMTIITNSGIRGYLPANALPDLPDPHVARVRARAVRRLPDPWLPRTPRLGAEGPELRGLRRRGV